MTDLMILQKRAAILNTGYSIIRTKQGRAIEKTLVEQVRREPNIEIFEHHFAIEILTQHHLGEVLKKNYPDIKCFGAYVADLVNQKVITFLSKVTVIATGGMGNVYMTTTNPEIATGDGVAMVYRAKGILRIWSLFSFILPHYGIRIQGHPFLLLKL